MSSNSSGRSKTASAKRPRRHAAEQAALALADMAAQPELYYEGTLLHSPVVPGAAAAASTNGREPRAAKAMSPFMTDVANMLQDTHGPTTRFAVRTVVVPKERAEGAKRRLSVLLPVCQEDVGALVEHELGAVVKETVAEQARLLHHNPARRKVRDAAAAVLRRDWLLLGLVGSREDCFCVYGVSAAPSEDEIKKPGYFHAVPESLLAAFHGPRFDALAHLGDSRSDHLTARCPPAFLAPFGYDPRHVIDQAVRVATGTGGTQAVAQPPPLQAIPLPDGASLPRKKRPREGVIPPPVTTAAAAASAQEQRVPPAERAESPPKKRARLDTGAPPATESLAQSSRPPKKRTRTEARPSRPVRTDPAAVASPERSAVVKPRFTNESLKELVRARSAFEEAVAARLLPSAAVYRAASAAFARPAPGLVLPPSTETTAAAAAVVVPLPEEPAVRDGSMPPPASLWFAPAATRVLSDSWQHNDPCPVALRELLDRTDASGFGAEAPPAISRLHRALAVAADDAAGENATVSSVDLTVALLLAAQPEAAAAHYFWAWQAAEGVTAHASLVSQQIGSWVARAETGLALMHLLRAVDASAGLTRALWRCHTALGAPTQLLRFAAFMAFAVQRLVRIDLHRVTAEPPQSSVKSSARPHVTARCFATGKPLAVGDEICLLRCRLAPDAAQVASGSLSVASGICTLVVLRDLPRALLGPAIVPAAEAIMSGGEPDAERRYVTLFYAAMAHATAAVNRKELPPLPLPSRLASGSRATAAAAAAATRATRPPVVEVQWIQMLETRTARALSTLAFDERARPGRSAASGATADKWIDSSSDDDDDDNGESAGSANETSNNGTRRLSKRAVTKCFMRAVCTSLRLVWAKESECDALTARILAWPTLDYNKNGTAPVSLATQETAAVMAGGLFRC